MTTTTPHPECLPPLDLLLVEPARLLIVAALVAPASHRVDVVANSVGIEADALLRHLERLREAGYVQLRRDGQRRAWTWITADGQGRLVAHLRALRVLLAKVDVLVAQPYVC